MSLSGFFWRNLAFRCSDAQTQKEGGRDSNRAHIPPGYGPKYAKGGEALPASQEAEAFRRQKVFFSEAQHECTDYPAGNYVRVRCALLKGPQKTGFCLTLSPQPVKTGKLISQGALNLRRAALPSGHSADEGRVHPKALGDT